MSTIEKLTTLFSKFPGIGPRQARRFVYYLLRSNSENTNELLRLAAELKNSVRQCPSCCCFFEESGTLCASCNNPHTDKTILMLVEKEVDVENIKKSDTYGGAFFVLGGLLPLAHNKASSLVRIDELIRIVEERARDQGLKEIIAALSTNPEGENTVLHVKQTLRTLLQKHHITFSTLGRGLSTGAELEYVDTDTIKNALENRK